MSKRTLVSFTLGAVMVGLFAIGTAQADQAPCQHRGPPPEAFSACENKRKGAACSVTFHDRTIDGTCSEPPPGVTDTRLACRPNGPPPSAQ